MGRFWPKSPARCPIKWDVSILPSTGGKQVRSTTNGTNPEQAPIERGVWPATGYRLTGPELATLCIASGHSVRSFARLIGADGRKLRGKCLVDYSEDMMAKGAIDQMRTEAIKTTSKSSAAKTGPARQA